MSLAVRAIARGLKIHFRLEAILMMENDVQAIATLGNRCRIGKLRVEAYRLMLIAKFMEAAQPIIEQLPVRELHHILDNHK